MKKRRVKRKIHQYIAKEILEKLYIDEEYSISDLEQKLNVSRSRIEKLFIEYNIKKKTQSEILKSKRVKAKTKNTVNERYGGFTFESKELREKVKNTNIKKYGVENPAKCEKVKEKRKNTVNERYGGFTFESKELREKVKNTNIKKYGVENPAKCEKVKEKIKETKFERYGDENYNNIEKNKQTCLERYGVDNPSKLDEIKDKKVQTSLEKYGVEYPWQLEEIKKKVKNIMLNRYGVTNALLLDTSIKRARQKMKEVYGVEYGFQSLDIQKKIYRNLYKVKEYKFLSGRISYVMGYENIMLDILLYEGFNEKDLLTNYECPIIKWMDKNKKVHKHIPDIYIKSLNKIIEVKSEWTVREECLEDILLKKKYAEEQGFEYIINVIDKKTKSILYEVNSN